MINVVHLYGEEEEIKAVRESLMQKDTVDGVLDFERLIPMPESLNITCGSATSIGIRLYLSAAAGKEWEALAPYRAEQVSEERLGALEYLYPGKMFKSEEELLKKTEAYDRDRLIALGKTAVENKEPGMTGASITGEPSGMRIRLMMEVSAKQTSFGF